jgi:peptidoglycan hydrolase CwlO-like protein
MADQALATVLAVIERDAALEARAHRWMAAAQLLGRGLDGVTVTKTQENEFLANFEADKASLAKMLEDVRRETIEQLGEENENLRAQITRMKNEHSDSVVALQKHFDEKIAAMPQLSSDLKRAIARVVEEAAKIPIAMLSKSSQNAPPAASPLLEAISLLASADKAFRETKKP